MTIACDIHQGAPDPDCGPCVTLTLMHAQAERRKAEQESATPREHDADAALARQPKPSHTTISEVQPQVAVVVTDANRVEYRFDVLDPRRIRTIRIEVVDDAVVMQLHSHAAEPTRTPASATDAGALAEAVAR